MGTEQLHSEQDKPGDARIRLDCVRGSGRRYKKNRENISEEAKCHSELIHDVTNYTHYNKTTPCEQQPNITTSNPDSSHLNIHFLSPVYA